VAGRRGNSTTGCGSSTPAAHRRRSTTPTGTAPSHRFRPPPARPRARSIARRTARGASRRTWGRPRASTSPSGRRRREGERHRTSTAGRATSIRCASFWAYGVWEIFIPGLARARSTSSGRAGPEPVTQEGPGSLRHWSVPTASVVWDTAGTSGATASGSRVARARRLARSAMSIYEVHLGSWPGAGGRRGGRSRTAKWRRASCLREREWRTRTSSCCP